MNAETKRSVIETYRQHEQDSGSVQVQIALQTKRINELASHFKQNPHDYSSERGLLRLVNQRRTYLSYLARKNPAHYTELIRSLGIRK